MATGTSVEGHLNPVSFCFHKAAYGDFDVYDTDFITTVKDIATNGYSGVLKVRPICGNLASTSKHFMWGPDGEYASSVELMAIQFLVYIDVLDQKRLPSWLIDNLSTVRAVHTVHGPVSRGIALFRQTIKSNKVHRTLDPLMIDNFITNNGFGSPQNSKEFIEKYKNSVYYDKSLQLKDSMSPRQEYLLSASERFKRFLKDRINEKGSFENSALTLVILGNHESYAGQVLCKTSHRMWRDLGLTTEESAIN